MHEICVKWFAKFPGRVVVETESPYNIELMISGAKTIVLQGFDIANDKMNLTDAVLMPYFEQSVVQDSQN